MKKMFLTILCLSVFIIGCSSNSGTTPDSPSQQTDNKGNKQTEILYAAPSNADGGVITRTIELFEKENPDIKVKVQFYPYTKLLETNEIQLSAKSEDIDVVTVDIPLVTSYTLKGYLEPLDDLLGAEVKDKWIKSAVEAGSYEGKLMAAPMNSSAVVMFYNKDILKKNNVPFPSDKIEDRLTWEEVVDMAKKMTSKNVYGFSVDQVGRAYQFLPIANSKGAKVISDNGIVSEGFTNSPEMIESLQFYSDLYNTWKVSPKIKREESMDYFISGKIGMFLSFTQNLPRIKESGLDFGIAPHPYMAGGDVATPTGSFHIGVSKYSTKKEAAAKFVKFITYGNGAKTWFEDLGALPAHTDLLDMIETDPKYEAFPENTLRLAAYEARNTAVPRPLTPGYLEWESNVNKALEDIKNGSDPKATIDNAVKLIDNQMKKYAAVVK